MHNQFIQLSDKKEISDSDLQQFSSQEKANQRQKYRKKNSKEIRGKSKKRERMRVKSENWDYPQIFKIFTLYSEYGSQWKIMQTQFNERPANSIKNRFYTVIRTFLKLLFKYHPGIINKLPHEIPSKSILKFYESREEFQQFNNLGKRILKQIDYNLNSHQLKKIVLENMEEIIEIYQLIFNIKVDQQNSCLKQMKSLKKIEAQEKNVQLIKQQKINNIFPKCQPIQPKKPNSQFLVYAQASQIRNETQNNSQDFVLLIPIFSFYQNSQINPNTFGIPYYY